MMDSNCDDSYESSDTESTLSQCITDMSDMSEAAKARVDKVTSKCCLITGGPKYLDYVHCLPTSTKKCLLDRLAFAWNEQFPLNLDTRYNILRLSPTFRRAFNENDWLLLPETWIIDAYYNARNTQKLPDIDAKVHQYTFIAHENMRGLAIPRQQFLPPKPMEPSTEDFSHYHYPYHDFPTIESHVHPRFIICNSGSKLRHDLFPWHKGYGARTDDLTKVAAIWNSWRRVVPTGEIVEKTPEDGDPDIKDSNSQATHCVYRSPHHKRKATEEHDSSMPKSSKRRTLQDGVSLNDETLHAFD
ncbi:hypothetical protein EDB89DRAFT_978543 [Lactarius sanguifluus]|nr:hypothetical protein EDB89DRAFT_978543 [Lactarius sanguifluus]